MGLLAAPVPPPSARVVGGLACAEPAGSAGVHAAAGQGELN